MWNVIPLNAEDCFRAWIFHEREFTDPLLKGWIFNQYSAQNIKSIFPKLKLNHFEGQVCPKNKISKLVKKF